MARVARVKVLKAVAGRKVGGRFVRNPRRNIAAGFHDEEGQFHPIRASFDYDPGRAGESRRPRKKKAAAKKKAAPKKKRVKAGAKRKAKATKKKRSR
ncbi:MAG: hypothetical protein IVW54_16570 [Candidatus Binataceae bacterium]|nr:hypothetical protein [Candidatus Binataceae bacterium]